MRSSSRFAGTVQLWSRSGGDAAAVTERRPVAEGSRIVTDASSKGVLTLTVDEAGQLPLATVQLSPSTSVALEEARSPRFNVSRDPHRAQLDFPSGRLFVTIQQADERDAQMTVTTPNGEVRLGPGIYDITANEQETRVRVRSGVATVHGAGREVEVNPGERVNVQAGRPPEFPVSDTVNLIVNGSFEKQLAPLWQENAEVKPGYTPGSVELVQDDRRNALRFSRRTEEQVPNRVWVSQTVDRDVEGYDNLALRLDLKVLYQSVPGGGEKDSEYPVMVDLAYTDIYGKDLHWYIGFLCLRPAPRQPVPEAERRARAAGRLVHLRVAQPVRVARGNAAGPHQQRDHLRQRARLRKPRFRRGAHRPVSAASHKAAFVQRIPASQRCHVPPAPSRAAAARLLAVVPLALALAIFLAAGRLPASSARPALRRGEGSRAQCDATAHRAAGHGVPRCDGGSWAVARSR